MRNIVFSDLADYLMHGREIEFAYKGRKYSITNHSRFWHLCDDTENILLDTVCRFEEKEVLVLKLSTFVIDDMTIQEIFDKQVYDTKGLPEVIADSYNAVSIRTLNNELIEVVYRDGDFEICIRKQKGEGQDISGDYNKYETCTETNHNGGTITNYHNSNNNAMKQLISYKGYSWSLVAPNGYWGDSNWDFVGGIFL